MIDDFIVTKRVSLERCIRQIRSYYAEPRHIPFAEDYLVQDAITQNIQRACEICIDMANHTVRLRKLGVPQTSRDSFELLAEAGVIPNEVAAQMSAMIGFRNVLVHQYQDVDIEIMTSVIEERLDDLMFFTDYLLTEMNK